MRFVTERHADAGDHTNWDIEDVLRWHGWDGVARGPRRGWMRVRCPWHLDREPSAGISETLNAYRCFSCDRAGNSVTLVMAEHGLDAAGAVEWLTANIDGTPGEPSSRSPEAKAGPRIPWEPMTLR